MNAQKAIEEYERAKIDLQRKERLLREAKDALTAAKWRKHDTLRAVRQFFPDYDAIIS